MYFEITHAGLSSIKKAATPLLPMLGSSLRSEYIAAGFGFRTYASLIAALKAGPICHAIDMDAMRQWVQTHVSPVDIPRIPIDVCLYAALASSAPLIDTSLLHEIHAQLDADPDLTMFGYLAHTTDHAAHARQCLYDRRALLSVSKARIWLRHQKKTSTLHAPMDLALVCPAAGTDLHAWFQDENNAIPEGAMIVAARLEGFLVQRVGTTALMGIGPLQRFPLHRAPRTSAHVHWPTRAPQHPEMASPSHAQMLTQALRPLARFYSRPNVEHVAIHQPQKVSIQYVGGLWVEEDVPSLTYARCAHICKHVAEANAPHTPGSSSATISCKIPDTDLYFHALVGNHISYNVGDLKGLAISIRSSRSIALQQPQPASIPPDIATMAHLGRRFHMQPTDIQGIQNIVAQGGSILVSGPTNSGKTMFVQDLVNLVPIASRIVAVEDVPEYTIQHPNRIHIKVSRPGNMGNITSEQATSFVEDTHPDLTIYSEVSWENAPFVSGLMEKGYALITTIHAATIEDALKNFIRLASAASQRGVTVPSNTPTIEDLQQSIGCIIQMGYVDGQRCLLEVVFPKHSQPLKGSKDLKEIKEIKDPKE